MLDATEDIEIHTHTTLNGMSYILNIQKFQKKPQ